LTFHWSISDFLSYLENSVALSHISELHTLLRKLSYTHVLHELSNLFKIYICREICAYWKRNSQLYLCIFLKCYLTALSVVYTSVFWSHFLEKKKYFSANFPLVLDFLAEASRQSSSWVWTHAAQSSWWLSYTSGRVQFYRALIW